MSKYILALDQGTTSSRAVLFDKDANIVDIAQKEFVQIYPKPGWVEHNPLDIWSTQRSVITEVVTRSSISVQDIEAIGITNQRETTLVWDKNTGIPVYNAIVWQCRRTVSSCNELKEQGFGSYIKEATGLIIDPYFSATKIKWILDNVPDAKEKAERGELLFGTVDTWLVWKLTEGEVFVTDYTNASRTMLFNIHNLTWDQKILDILDIPKSMLPTVKSSSEIYGEAYISGYKIKIAGIAGDQQAALFGQTCFHKGDVKNTYGTGGFMMLNTGKTPIVSKNGLLTTIGIGLHQDIDYALEGSIFVAGAAVQWLRDELKIINESDESEYFASKVKDTLGVYMVPAFVGLGSPYWDSEARGIIIGLTRGTSRNHIIRATLESIAYQSADLLHAMEQDMEDNINHLKVDGGVAKNKFLMQFQADIMDKNIILPKVVETTALGVAFLAGLAVGFWSSKKELEEMNKNNTIFYPNMEASQRKVLVKGWKKAVSRSLNWLDTDDEKGIEKDY